MSEDGKKTPKVTIGEAATPSEEIVASAKKSVTVVDKGGRAITVRRLSALNRLDLSVILGGENAANPAVLGPCALAFAVTSIDGEPVYQPNSYAELRNLVGTLDEDGLEAVALAQIAHLGFMPDGVDVDPVKLKAEATKTLKNYSRTPTSPSHSGS